MTSTQDLQTDEQLLAWDWRAELKRQGRRMTWLAEVTGKSQNTVYAYAYGNRPPPLAWLREAARILNGVQAA